MIPSRERAAYHEAGHTVAYMRLFPGSFVGAYICRDAGGGTEFLQLKCPLDTAPRVRDNMRCIIAGAVAEEMRSSPGSRPSWTRISARLSSADLVLLRQYEKESWRLAPVFGESHDSRRAAIAAETVSLLTVPRNWEAVNRIADVLLFDGYVLPETARLLINGVQSCSLVA